MTPEWKRSCLCGPSPYLISPILSLISPIGFTPPGGFGSLAQDQHCGGEDHALLESYADRIHFEAIASLSDPEEILTMLRGDKT